MHAWFISPGEKGGTFLTKLIGELSNKKLHAIQWLRENGTKLLYKVEIS